MLTAIFIFLTGLIIGSFLNVCIYRLPRDLSVASPPSSCTACGARLKAQDLMPVLSYLLLRGRCRQCGARFSARYAVVELLTGGLFVWCFLVIGLGPELIKALILTSFLIIITFIDLDHQLILDKLTLPLAIAGVAINLAMYEAPSWAPYLGLFGQAYTIGLVDMVIAALVGGGFILLVAVISRGGMGGGDIKFCAALGIWFGWKLTVLTLFLSFFIGGFIGGLLMLLKLKGRKDFIPFGPFIAAAAYIALLYGINILRWYLGRYS